MVSVETIPSAEIAVNPALTRFQVFDVSKLLFWVALARVFERTRGLA